jgi:hypothetical protein
VVYTDVGNGVGGIEEAKAERVQVEVLFDVGLERSDGVVGKVGAHAEQGDAGEYGGPDQPRGPVGGADLALALGPLAPPLGLLLFCALFLGLPLSLFLLVDLSLLLHQRHRRVIVGVFLQLWNK